MGHWKDLVRLPALLSPIFEIFPRGCYPRLCVARDNRHVVPAGVWREIQPIDSMQAIFHYMISFLVPRNLEYEENGRGFASGVNEE